MRICHIWQNFFPIESGGVERYVLSLSDFLHQKDGTQFILITDKAAYVPLSQSLRVSKSQKINSIDVNRLGPTFSSILSGSFFKILRRQSKTLNALLVESLFREAGNIRGIENVDVFHIHGFWQSLYPTIGLRLSEHFHRPAILTLHGDSISKDDPFSMPLRTQETIDILRRVNAITTFSNETFNALKEQQLNQSILMPNFINTESFKRPTFNNNRSGTKIVMISRLSKPKDPITPIRAFAKVKKQVPEATFQIVGYGPLFEQANLLVQELNLQGVVTFSGVQSDVRNFLWNSDICITTRGSYITTLEAWAAGVPVIAPKFGIMKQLISDGVDGLLADPGDTDLLASELISLIKDKQRRSVLTANGLKSAEKHDIKNVAPLIADIYKSVANQFFSS